MTNFNDATVKFLTSALHAASCSNPVMEMKAGATMRAVTTIAIVIVMPTTAISATTTEIPTVVVIVAVM